MVRVGERGVFTGCSSDADSEHRQAAELWNSYMDIEMDRVRGIAAVRMLASQRAALEVTEDPWAQIAEAFTEDPRARIAAEEFAEGVALEQLRLGLLEGLRWQ